MRFTKKGDVLYAISLSWTDTDITIHSIRDDLVVDKVSMLGSEEEISWQQNPDGLNVSFPNDMPTDHAHVLKITFKGS